jgi:hypothetical protein
MTELGSFLVLPVWCPKSILHQGLGNSMISMIRMFGLLGYPRGLASSIILSYFFFFI